MFFEALKRQRAGEDILMVCIGEHDFDAPAQTIEACKNALDTGHHNYTEIPGKPDLRDAMARVSTIAVGTEVSPEEVISMPGGQAGLYASMQATLNPGDHVVSISPYYVTYPGTIRAAGATATFVEAYSEDGFQPRAENLEAAIQKNTKAILINSPNNPTCSIYSRETIEMICDICKRHDLWLISDEVYWSLSNGQHVSPFSLPGMKERTVVILSMSKSHGMTGWRVGWVVADKALTYYFTQHNLVCNYGMCDFITEAATKALNGDFGVEEIANTYRKRGEVFLEALGQTNDIKVMNEPGNMYIMLDIRAKASDTQRFAFELLDAEKVAVMPGESFGAPAAGHIRISLGQPEDKLREAAGRIRRFITNYSQ